MELSLDVTCNGEPVLSLEIEQLLDIRYRAEGGVEILEILLVEHAQLDFRMRPVPCLRGKVTRPYDRNFLRERT